MGGSAPATISFAALPLTVLPPAPGSLGPGSWAPQEPSPTRQAQCPRISLGSLLWAASLSGLLLGCQPRHPANQLVVASKSSLDSVDPIDVTTLAGTQLLSAIGDPLYASQPDGSLRPQLATAFPRLSADGTRATIPLRQGVTFHDGTRFDAEAMVFSLERFRRLGKLSYLLDDRIKAVRARGAYELELQLSRPGGGLAALLSTINLTPVSPTAYRSHAEGSWRDRFVGTGPYRLAAYTPQRQQLEPYAAYWGPPARNRGVYLVTLSNSTALYGALLSGEVDVLLSSGLDSDQQRSLERRVQQHQFVEGKGPAVEIGYLTLASDRGPLRDPRLRQALALGLDRDLISRRVSFGMRDPLRSLIPAPLPGSSPATWPAYQPAGARALLRQAGYCRGRVLQVPLTFRSNIPSDRLFALTWQAQLRRDLADCLTLEITGVESTTAYRQLADGAFPMIFLDWTGDYPDPNVYLMPLLGCSKAQGNRCLEGNSVSSGSFWTAPGLEKELRALETLEGSGRTSLLATIQGRVAQGGAYLPVWRVAPRAWARRSINQPRFDGSGRILLQALERIQP